MSKLMQKIVAPLLIGVFLFITGHGAVLSCIKTNSDNSYINVSHFIFTVSMSMKSNGRLKEAFDIPIILATAHSEIICGKCRLCITHSQSAVLCVKFAESLLWLGCLLQI